MDFLMSLMKTTQNTQFPKCQTIPLRQKNKTKTLMKENRTNKTKQIKLSSYRDIKLRNYIRVSLGITQQVKINKNALVSPSSDL